MGAFKGSTAPSVLILVPLVKCADHRTYSRTAAKSKKGRGKRILDRIALQPRLTGLQSTLALANSSHFLSPLPRTFFLESQSVRQADAYLGLNTLIELVIFEGERILVLLRPGPSHVAFLGTHHQITCTYSRCRLELHRRGKKFPPQVETTDSDPEEVVLLFPSQPSARLT